MSYIAHPLPDPPPLRALRALQGRGKFGAAIQICVDNRDFEQVLTHHDSLFVDGAGFAVEEMGDAFLDDPAPVNFGVAVVVAHIMGEHFVVAVFIADKGYLAIGDAFRAVAG